MNATDRRKWVYEWWINQMRSKNAPDLEEFISVEQFEFYSEALANIIENGEIELKFK